MPTSLFRLVVSAATTTNTDTNPAVSKYFYNLQAGHRTGAVTTIPSTSFTDDTGTAVASNLTTATANDGYYYLFVNGVLQQSNLFTVSTNGSQVVISKTSTVPVSAPITLAVNNFAPTSTSTTTVTT
ncbi:MAG: hypothetical protein VR72_07325 [Clostridiaceae bacterium BRH_c20a]|nr:MAG: hypothetical protein VR72_07325 [Clostridiaceae bacterium BRH_c20a]